MPLIQLQEAREHWRLDDAAAQARPGNLFPSRIARTAVIGNEYFLRVLDGLALSGFEPRPLRFVAVPKLDGGTRPAADMPIEDEVLLTAIVQSLRSSLHPDLVAFTGDDISYAEFERYPLTLRKPRAFVLLTDVVSFYDYVDHDRLERELVGMTGMAETAEALVDLLEVWMGGAMGLPQGPHASEPLADIYISPASRALSRAGFDHSRFSDDFRVPASSWSEARAAQLILERSLREIGLTLSASKVRTPRLQTYRGYLEQIPTTAELSPTEREVLETEADEYMGRVTYTQVASEQELERAEQIYAEQIVKRAVDVVSTRLMRWCLPRLGAAASTAPLDQFRLLTYRYAHITPAIAVYLQTLMGSEFEGQAAIVAATENALPPHRRFFDIYEQSPEATKPDLVAAVVWQEPSWAATFLRGAATTPVLAAVASMDRPGLRDSL